MTSSDATSSRDNLHPLDAAIALQPETADSYRGHISRAYANMVGPFGGVISATLLNAVLSHPDRQGEPLAMTVNFAGPIAQEDFQISLKNARTNRSTQHWSLELAQNGQIAATATVVLALRRESWSDAELKMPEVPEAEAVAPLATTGYPAWTRNYAMRVVQGGITLRPDDSNADSTSILWVRDEPRRPLDYLSLMALSDCFFPRVFIRRQQLMPASTVSLTTYFHTDEASLKRQGDQELLGVARARRFHQGYFDQSAELWGRDGELLATSHQIVYFNDKSAGR